MAAIGLMAHLVPTGLDHYQQQYSMYQTRPHQFQADPTPSVNGHPYVGYEPRSQPLAREPERPKAESGRHSNLTLREITLRPSLPSISNLLGIANGERDAQDSTSEQQQQPQTQQAESRPQRVLYSQPSPSPRDERRYNPQYLSRERQRIAIPPTPPVRSDSVVESTHSPSRSVAACSVPATQPFFTASALNNVEAEGQRVAVEQFVRRSSMPKQPNVSPYIQSHHSSPFVPSPATVPSNSQYPHTQSTYTAAPPGGTIFHQQPLPSNFPPPLSSTPTETVPPTSQQGHLPTGNPWEHHHYISSNSQSIYPQSQDRYICSACDKAFSRPSSLKIHSHSHTGERPFKCPHAGCGKAFSVRSNMKRHERGCHVGRGPPAATYLCPQ